MGSQLYRIAVLCGEGSLASSVQNLLHVLTQRVAERSIIQEEDSPLSKPSPDIGSTAHVATPTEPMPSEVFVMIYLLENNKLLSATENQLKKNAQVRSYDLTNLHNNYPSYSIL